MDMARSRKEMGSVYTTEIYIIWGGFRRRKCFVLPCIRSREENTMIYSASRRTDMPAFFPDAIVDRVRRSRKLEAIVLWTKDIRNLVRHLGLSWVVRSVPAVVQFTVTGLAGSVWEPRAPCLSEQLGELSEVAAILPRGAIRWRFDPILPGPDVPERFRRVKGGLETALGGLDGVTVSFPDPYRLAVARAGRAGLVWPRAAPAEKRDIVAMMAAEFPRPDGMEESRWRPVRLCCEPELLVLPGVGRARCIDGALFEKLYGLPLGNLEKDAGQRMACGCVKSTDIGSYAMRCPHRCLYCYARPEEG
jgi:hypothetical protein